MKRFGVVFQENAVSGTGCEIVQAEFVGQSSGGLISFGTFADGPFRWMHPGEVAAIYGLEEVQAAGEHVDKFHMSDGGWEERGAGRM